MIHNFQKIFTKNGIYDILKKMRKVKNVYLAHIKLENGVERGQTVKEHLESTARLCSEYASKTNLPTTGFLLGLLHDMGKLQEQFNSFIHNVLKKPMLKSNIDHSTCGAVYVTELADEILKQRIQEVVDIDIFHLTVQIVSTCILSHHGGLIDIITFDSKSTYLRRIYKDDIEWKKQYIEAVCNFEKIYSRQYIIGMIIDATKELKEFYSKKIVTYPNGNRGFMVGMLCKFLFSCLIDADRYDTAAFAYGITPSEQVDYQCVWEKYTKIINQKVCELPKDTKINELRQKISDHCAESAKLDTGIYRLSCPTGSGKNFAVTRFALAHAKKHHKNRIFYVIPYTCIIEQNSEAIRSLLNLKTDESEIKQLILELHSAKQEELLDETNEDELLSENGMKKQLSAERLDSAITFMTMVRFLNICFASGTKGIRALHNLSNSIIIFDEIQTLPTKQIALFNAAVDFLSKCCNTTMILSTATQPVLDEVPKKVLQLSIKTEHELSGSTDEMIRQFKRTVISTEKYTDQGIELQKASQMIEEELQKNRNILFVVNSKSAVDQLFKEVREQVSGQDTLVYKLTTDICAENRRVLIKKIRENLFEEKRLIVISTKLIEAGVDISFRVVYRSLSGLDSLIQCAGRCNRNGEFNKGEFGCVYLVNLEFDDVSRMHDVLSEQEAMRKLLHRYLKNQELYNNDLSSERAIHDYFSLYYKEQEECMEYPIPKNERLTEYEVLNINKQLLLDFIKNQGNESMKKLRMFQSFHTAASYYKVIDDYGTPVVVPYEEGKKIIADLCSDISYHEKIIAMKKSQRYIVNVSQGKFKRLVEKEIVVYYPEIDTWILKESYYSDTYGVSEDPVSLSLLSY